MQLLVFLGFLFYAKIFFIFQGLFWKMLTMSGSVFRIDLYNRAVIASTDEERALAIANRYNNHCIKSLCSCLLFQIAKSSHVRFTFQIWNLARSYFSFDLFFKVYVYWIFIFWPSDILNEMKKKSQEVLIFHFLTFWYIVRLEKKAHEVF